MGRCAWLAIALVLGAGSAPPKPVLTIHADARFLDDAFALSPSGDRLAFIRTNGAEQTDVEIVGVPGGASQSHFPLRGPAGIPERLVFTRDGQRVIVIARE